MARMGGQCKSAQYVVCNVEEWPREEGALSDQSGHKEGARDEAELHSMDMAGDSCCSLGGKERGFKKER